MINVMTAFGTSFKGLTAYLMHDEGHAVTTERVAWTHTHNLATEDPQKAARIMAATALGQAELKAAAGIKNTGRKSNKHVMHYVLSWGADEHGEYSKEEMVDAAIASLTYIGVSEGERIGKKRVAPRSHYADEHQAVIVCHDEGPGSNPHVHVMVNRVHPEHGVMVPDSNDFEKLSAWALDYRRSQGLEHYCPQRVKNAAKRAQGLLTSHPRKPRNIYEREQEILSADPGSEQRAKLEALAERAKVLKFKTERLKEKQAKTTHALEKRQLIAERAERDRAVEAIRQKRTEIKSAYEPLIDALSDRQAMELGQFHESRGTATGHVRNAWAAFQTKQWMNELRDKPVHAMKHAFGLAFSSGLQERDIKRHHEREHGELRGQRKAEERAAAKKIRTDEAKRLEQWRESYTRDRSDMVLTHRMDKAKLSAEWDQLAREHMAVQNGGGRSPLRDRQQSAEPSLTQEFNAQQPQPERSTTGSGGLSLDEMRRIAAELRSQQQADQAMDRNSHDLGISR